ncbi:MASE1 domain-containing protein [Bradyrhizobium sp. USDA 4541]|uniref:MASE1 domain-containing protein n=1 Tax=Bradyrhizobium sp. USDA 4541 TaxID=2817704 RepID=UPI0020A4AA16|nr:MASE1 domain-containing protein [Bradyrhizobium sp. USDA 4541]
MTYSIELFIVTAIYGSLAASAHFLPAINPTATPLWPPTGVALALMLLRGYRIWPAILVGAVAPYLITDRSLLEFVAAGIGTLLAALAGTWLIGRWSNGCQTFATPSGVAKFAGVSFAPTAMISSFSALAGSIFVNEPSFPDSVAAGLTWWLADAAAILVIAPVIVLWAMMPLRISSRWDLLESIAVIALAGLIGIVAYSPLIGSDLVSDDLNVALPHRSLLGFLALLPLIWTGLRSFSPESQSGVSRSVMIRFRKRIRTEHCCHCSCFRSPYRPPLLPWQRQSPRVTPRKPICFPCRTS